MNILRHLGHLLGKRRIVQRERHCLRVRPFDLGHGLGACRVRCAACGHDWYEVAAYYSYVAPCPRCGAPSAQLMPDTERPRYGPCDGPWLTGELDPLLTLAAVAYTGEVPT